MRGGGEKKEEKRGGEIGWERLGWGGDMGYFDDIEEIVGEKC
jgi:hypothetical protein